MGLPLEATPAFIPMMSLTVATTRSYNHVMSLGLLDLFMAIVTSMAIKRKVQIWHMANGDGCAVNLKTLVRDGIPHAEHEVNAGPFPSPHTLTCCLLNVDHP